jgi:endonuclease/exonuclease/phosphatase family metal-dependent hydrolase
MNKLIMSLICSLLIFFPAVVQSEGLIVMGYNVESGDADPVVVSQRIEAFEGCDIWGLSEVQSQSWADAFEEAAEYGENADFAHILGSTGGGDRLLIIYNADRFELIDSQELHEINIGGNVRAPLVAKLSVRSTGQEFWFMTNHLYRRRADRRHEQATLLNAWATSQALPVIATGDYNFDWSVTNGDADHDQGYDNITAGGVFNWVRPTVLVKTQDSSHDSVLDFVFVSGQAKQWAVRSEIIVAPGDFPDNRDTPDHRPVMGVFNLEGTSEITLEDVLEKIGKLESELSDLRRMVEQLR